MSDAAKPDVLVLRDKNGRYAKGHSGNLATAFKSDANNPRTVQRLKREQIGGRSKERSRRRFAWEMREAAFQALDLLGKVMRGEATSSPAQLAIAHRLLECAHVKQVLIEEPEAPARTKKKEQPIVVISNVPRSPYKKSGDV